MIHVIATIELVEGSREAFLQEFHRLVPLVRAEAGCLEYGPTVDEPAGLPRQFCRCASTSSPWWRSGPAWMRCGPHLQAPHMAEYRERVKELVKGRSCRSCGRRDAD